MFDEFKDPKLANELANIIVKLADKLERSVNIMEVCGSHTMAIARIGLRDMLPSNINLISGPGCPVCVTSNADIDKIIALAMTDGIAVATFGDMVRVPGSATSLQKARAHGANVQVVYSPLDALKFAQESPDLQVVFAGVGFETTAPLVASTIERAAALGVDNFSVMCAHKRVPPALRALASDGNVAIDAFLLPGHVSTILGTAPYQFLSEEFAIPGVVAGFDAVDILQAIAQISEQLVRGDARIEIAYKRAVKSEGNPVALAAMERTFDIVDATWRGLGGIPKSGYAIKHKLSQYDAIVRFGDMLDVPLTVEPKGCRCGDVLRGAITPAECPLFDKACTPEEPIGPCMVSSEGSCAAWWKYMR